LGAEKQVTRSNIMLFLLFFFSFFFFFSIHDSPRTNTDYKGGRRPTFALPLISPERRGRRLVLEKLSLSGFSNNMASLPWDVARWLQVRLAYCVFVAVCPHQSAVLDWPCAYKVVGRMVTAWLVPARQPEKGGVQVWFAQAGFEDTRARAKRVGEVVGGHE